MEATPEARAGNAEDKISNSPITIPRFMNDSFLKTEHFFVWMSEATRKGQSTASLARALGKTESKTRPILKPCTRNRLCASQPMRRGSSVSDRRHRVSNLRQSGSENVAAQLRKDFRHLI